jgi:hypothetical protein
MRRVQAPSHRCDTDGITHLGQILPGYTSQVAEPAQKRPVHAEDAPLDPHAIERAYRRERARRRARHERHSKVRRSNVRFWVSLLALTFLAAFVILAAWHEVATLFGV